MKRGWLIAIALLGGCHTGAEPCTTSGSCSSASECLANRCRPRGSDPVAPDSERIVLAPTVLRVVSEQGAAAPTAVVFGSETLGPETLYLQFPRAATRTRTLDAAFLLLEPMPGTAAADASIDVQVHRISEDWQPSAVTHIRRPKLGPPSSSGLARAATLRVDVTPLVRHLLEHPRQDHGMAVVSAGGHGHGVSFSTGFQAGLGPRLELYLRRR
jgi:hypothetical protein